MAVSLISCVTTLTTLYRPLSRSRSQHPNAAQVKQRRVGRRRVFSEVVMLCSVGPNLLNRPLSIGSIMTWPHGHLPKILRPVHRGYGIGDLEIRILLFWLTVHSMFNSYVFHCISASRFNIFLVNPETL